MAAPWKMKGWTPAPAANASLTPDQFMAQQTAPPAADPATLTPDSFMAKQGTPSQASANNSQSKVEEPGMLTKAWRFANKGLISGESLVNAASALTPRPADMLPNESPYQYLRRNQASLDPDHPILAAIRSGLSGTIPDLADLVSSFTSPASLALLAAGGAGKIPGAVGKVAKAAQLLGSGTYAAKGASDMLDASSKPGAMSPEDLQKFFYGGATAVGGTAGAADAVSGLSPETGARMMNRIVRPGVKFFKMKQNPGQAVLDEGLTANNTEDLADKIQTRRGEIGQNIRQIRTGPAGQAVSVDATKAILDPINDAMQQAQKDGRADLHQKLQDVQNQLTQEWAPDANGKLSPTGPRKLSGLNAQELYDLKHQVDNVTKWSGAGFDSELNQVKVAVRSNLRDLENQNLPEVAPYRLRYGAMKNAEIPAETRAAAQERNAALSLPDYLIAGQGVVPGIARMIQGDIPQGVTDLASGVGLMALKRGAQSPALQTRVAQWLGGNTPEPTGPITQAIHSVAAPFRPASAAIAAAPKYRLKKAR